MFWVREAAGWLLVLAGGYLILVALGALSDRQVIEGGILAMVGVMVFRGGNHLVKVATAARVVLEADRRRRAAEQSSQKGMGPF